MLELNLRGTLINPHSLHLDVLLLAPLTTFGEYEIYYSEHKIDYIL